VPVLLCAWPRCRYDQLMDIGWTRLIPLGLGVVLLNVAVGMMKASPERYTVWWRARLGLRTDSRHNAIE
jgi:hypothetical protein